MRSIKSMSCGALAALAGGHAAAAQHYVITTLDVPGQFQTQTTGTPGSLNDSDQVVGSTLSNARVYQGFVWSAGVFTLYGACDILAAINNKGLAVGYTQSFGGYCTVDTKTGKIRTLPVHAKGNLRLEAINIGGEALGQIETRRPITKGVALIGASTQVVQVPGSANKYGGTYPTGINDAGTIVGYYSDTAAVVHGFVGPIGSYTSFDVPSGTGTYPYFITPSGALGGGYLMSGSGGTTVGFVSIAGATTTILPPGAIGSYVQGIGPGGEIVGSFIDASYNTHGFVDRGGVYLQLDVPGASYTSVEGVNTLGSLVGNFRDSQGLTHAFIAQCPGGQTCTP